MARETFQIGVVVSRSPPVGRWGQESWRPVAALPAAPALALWSPLDASGAGDLRYAGAADVDFLSGQTSHYRDNLDSAHPAIWIALKAEGDFLVVRAASVDPYEGETMADGLEGNVEAVPMPAALRAALEDFVARFHVERPFVKRKRDRAGRREQGLE